LASAVLFTPLYVLRVPREERMLQAQFGPAYGRYMQQTGRVLPRLRTADHKG
jgi:protein-S-isoprenylcysteine O-methyltransferase Ste14